MFSSRGNAFNSILPAYTHTVTSQYNAFNNTLFLIFFCNQVPPPLTNLHDSQTSLYCRNRRYFETSIQTALEATFGLLRF
jgi:hypothetical protein